MAKFLQNTLIAGMLSLSAISAAQATVILGNFSGNTTTLGTTLTATSNTKAVGLTTGSADLRFDSLQAYMANASGASHTFTGGIYSNNAGNPGSLLAAFAPISMANGTPSTLLTFTANYTLSANTSYWFRLSSDIGNVVGMYWNDYSPLSALTAVSGITSLGYRFSNNAGSSWSSSGIFNAVQINATEVTVTAPVPEPETLLLFIPAVFGLLATKRRKA